MFFCLCRKLSGLAVNRSAAKLRKDAYDIFKSGVAAVLPSPLVHKALQVDGNRLQVAGRTYDLNHNVKIAAFGKAVLGMMTAAEEVIGEHICCGIGSVPANVRKEDFSGRWPAKIKIYKGARDNLPDEMALCAAMDIFDLALNSTENDILLVLMSGGGSALLPLPTPPLCLEEKLLAIKILSQAGATIQQLNTLRKHLSMVKGGHLASVAYPAQVISLILSDVVGDSLDTIASGPTYPNQSTPQDCLDIISSLDVWQMFPKSITQFLEIKRNECYIEHTFEHVHNVLVGSNRLALLECQRKALHLGYYPVVLSSTLEGEARNVGMVFATLCASLLHGDWEKVAVSAESLHCEQNILLDLRLGHKKPYCLIAGGETTVHVQGSGVGGRNQELALAAAISLRELLSEDEFNRCVFLSAGTDGQDGPTSAAGAYGTADVVEIAQRDGLSPQQFLEQNDSFSFYSTVCHGEYSLVTGHTGTNTMDIQLALVN